MRLLWCLWHWVTTKISETNALVIRPQFTQRSLRVWLINKLVSYSHPCVAIIAPELRDDTCTDCSMQYIHQDIMEQLIQTDYIAAKLLRITTSTTTP
jgi:hypothetical protein